MARRSSMARYPSAACASGATDAHVQTAFENFESFLLDPVPVGRAGRTALKAARIRTQTPHRQCRIRFG